MLNDAPVPHPMDVHVVDREVPSARGEHANGRVFE